MIQSPKDVTEVAARHLCTGCGACAALFPQAIAMTDTEEVARRPSLRSSSPEAHWAAREALAVCPGLGGDHRNLHPKTGPRDTVDRDWGPVLEIWEGYAADPEIRYRGSSGGAATALSLFAIEQAGFAGVIHVAADPQDARLNQAVVSRDRDGLLRGAGSRYAPASPAEQLDAVARAEAPMLFTGKPCDVTAARAAARQDSGIADNLGLTLSIFCAGTPSIDGSRDLLARLGVPAEAEVTKLRYRGDGWPGEMQATWVDREGVPQVSARVAYREGWGEILQAKRQWRCHLCVDHSGEFADIAVGDPWHEPPKDKREAGRSLIVVRSERGRRFLKQARQRGYILAEPRDRAILYRAQPNLITTRGAVWGRKTALRLLGLSAPSTPGAVAGRAWLMALGHRQRLQSLLGTWKRVWRRALWRSERATAYRAPGAGGG
jgi:coenzyme F420 hydrogenase subunit beta